ncbi:hypothetical protein KCU61_g7661, partial [Aureobasidium melanogenum]
MTSKLIPPNPDKVMVIRNVTPDVVTLSLPFARFGQINIGGRGTLVRLQNGSVAVFSPVALTNDVQSQINKMGAVKYICANDAEHHIFMDDWHKAFPDAKLIGPDALKEKRESQKKPLPWTHLFRPKDNTSWNIDEAFDREFDAEYVHAHANKELVFNHKPSKTLIQADLLFNLPAVEQYSRTNVNPTAGILTKLFCKINTTAGSAIWQKRFVWYALSASDRPAFNQSMARIDRWDFERIIPCHGEVIEKEGKGIFRKVFEWHLEAAKKSN